ncbi:MAG TPA: TlpA disulfide reductase family protein [Bacillales bacterium]|nr:TlpA disulfide reductase family protein [Bacillales bacterium]
MVKKIIAAVVLITLLIIAINQVMDKKAVPESKSAETSTTTNNSKGLEAGAKAPDFELKTLTGETVKLSSLKGKKVMLNFWATWCPPCKAEMPDLEKLYKQKDNDLVILAVNIDPQLDVKGFAKEFGITFPILLDEDDSVNERYQIISIPTTYFIDRDGVIQSKFIGGMNLEKMKELTGTLK